MLMNLSIVSRSPTEVHQCPFLEARHSPIFDNWNILIRPMHDIPISLIYFASQAYQRKYFPSGTLMMFLFVLFPGLFVSRTRALKVKFKFIILVRYLFEFSLVLPCTWANNHHLKSINHYNEIVREHNSDHWCMFRRIFQTWIIYVHSTEKKKEIKFFECKEKQWKCH